MPAAQNAFFPPVLLTYMKSLPGFPNAIQMMPSSTSVPMMMNDPLPPPLQAPIPPLRIASHSMPQSLPPPDSNHEYIYKTCLVTVYDAFKHMQQWWPLLVYTIWPTPSTHDATTASLPLASTINHTSLNTSDSLPSLPCTSAPTNFCEHDLAAFAKELEQMKQYWLPPAKMPQPMSSLPVPSTA